MKRKEKKEWVDWYPYCLFAAWVVGCVVIGLKNGWS